MNTSSSFPEDGARQLPALRRSGFKDTKDTLSGLLNEKAAKEHILRRLGQMGETDVCALFLIDISGSKTERQETKEETRQDEESSIRYAGKVLSSLFRATDILGRLDNGLFLVF